MKVSFKLIGLVLLIVILATCKKDKVTEEEILTQQEQKIIDKVEGFMPEQIGSMYENQFSNLRTLKDYALYLDSIEASIDELKSAIELNFSLNEFEKAMNNALLALEDSEKGSLNDCMGLGYSKGVQIEVGGSGTLAYYVAAGLQAGGGGGIKVIYDFVNLDRQLYYYHLCTGGFTIGAGIGAAFNGCMGFSGVNEVITGIRYNNSNSGLNKFEGAGWSYEYSLSAKAATVLGVQISLGIGTSKSAYADFGSISNPIPCPEDVAKIENGTAEYSFQVQGTLSIGAQAELKAALSIDGVITNSYGVEKTYTNFASNRILAGTRMAREIMLPEPLDGIAAITNTFDLASAAVAIIYSLRDFSNCPPEIPSIGTIPITNITNNSATTGGFVEDAHGATVTERGVCWSTSANPTIALITKTSDRTGTGVFTSNITNLSASTKYYVRAYATNSAGTAYGKQLSFTTAPGNQSGTVTDRDQNSYKTVSIGSQTWMAENLKTTKYNDGTSIPNLTNTAQWRAATTGAYSWYLNNEATYKNVYGALYNWYAVNTTRLCPTGWHVPSDTEWKQLEMHLGMSQSTADQTEWRGAPVGGKLKETGTTHWNSPNTGATNETGFTALPPGIRWGISSDFSGIGANSAFWTSTTFDAYTAWYRALYWDRSTVCRADDPKWYGFPVRCMKN